MTKKNIAQKLISFESNGKDFSNLAKELAEGWTIIETAPHPSKKNVYFCKLEKNLNQTNTSLQELSVKDVLDLVQYDKIKDSKKSNIPISKQEILEDA